MTFLSKIFRAKPSNSNKDTSKPAAPAPEQTPESIADDQLLSYILATTKAEYCLAALQRITAEHDALTIAMQHNIAQVRLSAAQQVTSTEALQQLQNQAKTRDKAVFRLCKERLQEQRASVQEQQAKQERIGHLIASARYLNKIGYNPELSAKLQLLNKEWPELEANASAADRELMNQELAAASHLLAQHAEQEAQAKAEAAAAVQAAAEQQQLLQRIETLFNEAQQDVASNLQDQVLTLQSQWDQALRLHKPAAELSKTFEQFANRLLQLVSAHSFYVGHQSEIDAWLINNEKSNSNALNQVEHWLKSIRWPEGIAQPAWLHQIQQQYQQLQDQQQTRSHQQQQRIDSVKQQLQELEQAINNGLLKEANKLNQQIFNALRQLDSKQTYALNRQLKALSTRLNEMRDWAGFATAPKKEALVAAMEALVGADISADVLADKIHALQDEWKTLTGTPGDHELWERFRTAAEKAFEPCKQYFAEQAQVREQLTQNRRQLIAELSAYEANMNWAQADWKTVQKTLDAARDTFRTYAPVDRHAHKETQQQFGDICDKIYAHLKAEYDRNAQAKQALVEQAKTLASAESLLGAADQVKQLQNQWKAVGLTQRPVDQRLWQLFRQYCDAVFTRLDEQRNARKAELTETSSQAEALVNNALTALADNDNEALTQLNEVRNQLQALTLPKAVQQRLLTQVNDAQAQIKERLTAQKQNAERERRTGLIERIRHLHSSDEQWQQACALPLPSGFNADSFASARSQDKAAEGARDLCILLEIVADQPSPDSDKARRMELQVQRLAEGLGKALSKEKEVQNLVERWLTVSATGEQTERFIGVLKAL